MNCQDCNEPIKKNMAGAPMVNVLCNYCAKKRQLCFKRR